MILPLTERKIKVRNNNAKLYMVHKYLGTVNDNKICIGIQFSIIERVQNEVWLSKERATNESK